MHTAGFSYNFAGNSLARAYDKKELFYLDHFRSLEKSFPNFKFYIALDNPLEEDNWKEMKDKIPNLQTVYP